MIRNGVCGVSLGIMGVILAGHPHGWNIELRLTI